MSPFVWIFFHCQKKKKKRGFVEGENKEDESGGKGEEVSSEECERVCAETPKSEQRSRGERTSEGKRRSKGLTKV